MTPPHSTVNVEVIDVTMNAQGVAAAATTRPISGEVLAIGYIKDTVAAATSPTIATKNAPIQTLDSGYDVNGGNTVRYPRAAVTGASAGDNKWTPFVIDDTITVAVTGGSASKHCQVLIYYRR